MPACRAFASSLGRTLETVVLENGRLRATLLTSKGADIYALEDIGTGVDVLAKAPWGLREPALQPAATDSMVAWLDRWSGGWPLMFPSGGAAGVHQGVEHEFHGEASMSPWSVEILEPDGERAVVRLSVLLAHSPFRFERTVSVLADAPALHLHERVTNVGGHRMEYMWGHHPTFGPPFLAPGSRILCPAARIEADAGYDVPHSPLAPGAAGPWPRPQGRDGEAVDLSVIPGEEEPRQLLAYLGDFPDERAWFAVVNDATGLAVGVGWRRAEFPYAWLFQELGGSPGYPWYQRARLAAIEPCTSVPGHGLAAVIESTGTHRVLDPGASAEAQLVASLFPATEEPASALQAAWERF